MQAIITVEGHVSMGHRLPSYDGICSSLHGHNVRFVASVHASQFLDFKKLHVALQSIVHDFDHALVLHEKDPWAIHIKTVAMLADSLQIAFAKQQRLVLLNVEPSTEHIASYVFDELTKRGYNVERVTVHETDKYSATCTQPLGEVKRVL